MDASLLRKKWIVVAVAVLLVVTVGVLRHIRQTEKEAPSTGIQKQVRYSFTLKNTTNRLLDGGILSVSAPVASTAFQTSDQILANRSFINQKDLLGNQTLVFALDKIPPFSARIVQITASLTFHTPGLGTSIEVLKQYLSPAPYIESEHPDIKRLARQLTRSNPEKTANAIFSWVSSNIHSTATYVDSPRGALETLRTRQGDCTEYMDIFIALCRAGKIPARGIGGYICHTNCILKPSQYHNWAECYLDGTWVLADCQYRIFSRTHNGYVAMNILSDQRNDSSATHHSFTYRGPDVSVKMNH